MDLRQVLESALRHASEAIRPRAEIVTALFDIPEIRGDASQLEQVFRHLLIEAAEAMPAGRIGNTIQVTAYARSHPENLAVVEIQDNRCGISRTVPRGSLDAPVEPGTTAARAGGPIGAGSGFTVCECEDIVTSHGGALSVDSIENVKTTVRVQLPLVVPEAALVDLSAVPSPGCAVPSLAKMSVLVVDDEPSLGKVIRQLLLQDSSAVDVASTACEALGRIGIAVMSGAGYDVILCDLMLPDMTGMELYARVLEQHPEVAPRFVFMTGGASAPVAADFLASVANRRLDKPFDVATLRMALDPASGASGASRSGAAAPRFLGRANR